MPHDEEEEDDEGPKIRRRARPCLVTESFTVRVHADLTQQGFVEHSQL